MSQLSGWAGRAADILHSYYNTGATSMSISLGGNNVFQVGNSIQQFVVTPSGALSFEGELRRGDRQSAAAQELRRAQHTLTALHKLTYGKLLPTHPSKR